MIYLEKIKGLSKYFSLLPEHRLSQEEYFLGMAVLASLRGTCQRRQVGAILIDRNNYVISTGRNGNPSGVEHCNLYGCKGTNFSSGEGLDQCEAIHAEINAIAHCRDPNKIYKAYTTVSPCIHCIKALLATPCQEIIFLEEYPHQESKELWLKSKRKWTHYHLKT